MINILVVDDDALVRLGLVDLLSTDPELTVVAEAPDGQAAVEQAGRHRVDIALVDVRMPRVDGITATRRLRALPNPPRVITLTTFDLDEYVCDALAAGADGFLLKDTEPREIIRAVHVVADGQGMLHPAAACRLSPDRPLPPHRPPRSAPSTHPHRRTDAP